MIDQVIDDAWNSPGFRVGIGILGWTNSWRNIGSAAMLLASGNPWSGSALAAWGVFTHYTSINNINQGSQGNSFNDLFNPDPTPQLEYTAACTTDANGCCSCTCEDQGYNSVTKVGADNCDGDTPSCLAND